MTVRWRELPDVVRGVVRSPGLRHAPQALAVVVVVEVGLRVTTLPRLARLLGVPLAFDGAVPAPAGDALLGAPDTARYTAARHVTLFWPFGDNGPCLRLALTGARLLRHRGARVQIGVTRRHDRAATHAWVVVDGRSLDPEAAGYVPLAVVSP